VAVSDLTEFQVSRLAAVAAKPKRRPRSGLVEIFTVDPLVLAVAHEIAECACRVRIQRDGSAQVVNHCRPQCSAA
jgi:hypothetical protein